MVKNMLIRIPMALVLLPAAAFAQAVPSNAAASPPPATAGGDTQIIKTAFGWMPGWLRGTGGVRSTAADFTFAPRAPDRLSLAGCPLFPADNSWNARVDTLPVHPLSAQWVDSIGRWTGFHPDFGSGTYDGGPIGIPYNVVDGSVPKVKVTFHYGGESDPGPYPIPPDPLIEYGSDRHILILDRSTCTLYELFDAEYSGGKWYAGSGAIWDLTSNAMRPDTWTSADAAGLSILPGLVRYDEVAAGEITHAIRFTANTTNNYIWPARHLTYDVPDAPQIPPLGARFRLKASVDISGYPPVLQIILTAMKKYGIILADNGSSWFITGAPNEGWDNDLLHEIGGLTGDDFEAVDTSILMIDPDSGQSVILPHTCPLEGAALYDLTGDCRTDVAVYRPATGAWYVRGKPGRGYGAAGDFPVPGDYNGDGLTDMAVYRPATGAWYVRSQYSVFHGVATDMPVPGDYNGDGKTDVAVYRPSTGAWYIRGRTSVGYGATGDIPIPGDYNGDGTAEIAVYRPATGAWYVRGMASVAYGTATDIPVPGDYNGDGTTDVAVYRPATGAWYIRGQASIFYGAAGDVPVPGDYNGDGKTDVAVYRPATGGWYVRGQFSAGYGENGDIPIPELSTGKASTAP
jgi:hypothetical protein